MKENILHPQPLGWDEKVRYFSFLKPVVLHIKLKGKKCRPTCKQKLTLQTPLPWVKRSDIEIVQISNLAL